MDLFELVVGDVDRPAAQPAAYVSIQFSICAMKSNAHSAKMKASSVTCGIHSGRMRNRNDAMVRPSMNSIRGADLIAKLPYPHGFC